MTKTTKSTRRNKPIPVPVDREKVTEELNTSIQACNADPRYVEVKQHIEAHDAAIEAGAEGKELGWVLDALQIHGQDVMRNKRMIETAVKVFHGILSTLESADEQAEAAAQVELTLELAKELDEWANNGWETYMQDFKREVRGMSAEYLTDRLGFPADQVTISEGLGTVSISDTIYHILSNPKVLEHRGFRKFALSTFAAFYRYAFGQTGREDQDLLAQARAIDVSLYGEEKVAEREAERAKPAHVQTSTSSGGTGGRKTESKRRAQERGRAEYDQRMSNPETKRGYEQVGGRKGK